jgi:hypothetical protein
MLKSCTGGVIMNRHIIAALMIGALVVTNGIHESAAEAGNARIQSAVMQFNEPVRLLYEILKGEYLFLHHEGMMERGKPCTFVYLHDQGKPGRFVLSFHCRPVMREKADQFKITLSRKAAFDLPAIEEIQFAGSTVGHQVPQ